MKNKEFRSLSFAERQDRLERIIRTRTDDALERVYLDRIIQAIDVGEQYSVRVLNDSAAFEAAVTLRQVHVVLNGHEKSTVTKGQFLFGDFDFGQSVLKTDTLKQSSGKVHKAILLDSEKPAAALVEIKNLGYEDLSVLMNTNEIIIYMPQAAAEKAG